MIICADIRGNMKVLYVSEGYNSSIVLTSKNSTVLWNPLEIIVYEAVLEIVLNG